MDRSPRRSRIRTIVTTALATAALLACAPASGAERPDAEGADDARYGLGTAPGDLSGTPQEDPAGVTYGPEVKVGNGTARTFIVMAGNAPMEVGVLLTQEALDGLQGHHEAGALEMPDGHSMYETVLQLPSTNPTPYRHVVLNWNPGGHEPPGMYDTPHFDFHFFTISDEARRRITPADPAFITKAKRTPSAPFIPAGYILPDTLAIPLMGVHWIDPKSPEFTGQGFSRTFIFGSYDGELIFAEPMITKAFLESRPDVTIPLTSAQRYAKASWQPGSYTIRWEERTKQYRVSLSQLGWKE